MKATTRKAMLQSSQTRTRITSKPTGVILNPAKQQLPDIDPATGHKREGDIWTPWGYTDLPAAKYADGKIISFSTSCHGGFFVSPELNKQIPAEFRLTPGWYEEDCEWVIVVITFPQFFPKRLVRQAKNQFDAETDSA